MPDKDKCKCGSEEFYSFRVAGSTITKEHWSLECAKCGKVLRQEGVYNNVKNKKK